MHTVLHLNRPVFRVRVISGDVTLVLLRDPDPHDGQHFTAFI